jgi:hypothetical protein
MKGFANGKRGQGMTHGGLQKAIRAEGSVTARRLDSAQHSVSQWSLIPTEWVLSAESTNGWLGERRSKLGRGSWQNLRKATLRPSRPFFADLERVQTSNFYHHVGTVGRLFVEIEANAFAA